MLRPIRSLFIGVTVGLPLLSIMLMILLPRHLYYGNGAGFLLGLGIFSFIPSLLILGLYYADCSGTSKVQRMIIYPDKLVYSGYSGKEAFSKSGSCRSSIPSIPIIWESGR